MCIDSIKFNKVIVKNKYRLRRISDFFGQLQGSSYFSKIGLRLGCDHLKVTGVNINKEALRKRYCNYEFVCTNVFWSN